MHLSLLFLFFFFFNDTATTEIYTLSLHDALPISAPPTSPTCMPACCRLRVPRSEEHTSELQSHVNLVCRLLLEKKKKAHTELYINNKKETTNVTKKLTHTT